MKIRENDFELLAKLRDDPVAFIKFVYGVELSPVQQRICRKISEPGARVAVRSCHGSGKTFLAGKIVPWFVTTRAPAKVITTGAGGRSVDTQVWAEIRAAVDKAKQILGGRGLGGNLLPKRSEWIFGPEHFALGFSTDDINKFRGYHSPNLLVIGDEAAGLHPDIYTGIDGLTTGAKDRVLLIGNPGEAAGRFFEKFQLPTWEKIGISALEQPNYLEGREVFPGQVTREWVDRARIEWGEGSVMWKMLVLGEFPDEGINTLIRVSWAQAAVDRYTENTPTDEEDCEADDYADEPVVISCDVAHDGGDETVILTMQGPRVVHITSYVGRDLMETCGRIVKARMRYPWDANVTTVIDDPGLGKGVVHRLAELVKLSEYPRKPIAFNGGLAPRYRPRMNKDKRRLKFKNQRCQSWWEMREAFREGLVEIPDDKKLASQLCSALYTVHSNGLIEVEPKKEARKRGVSSPDRADALVMAWWARLRYGIVPEDKAPESPRESKKPRSVKRSAAAAMSAPKGDGW